MTIHVSSATVVAIAATLVLNPVESAPIATHGQGAAVSKPIKESIGSADFLPSPPTIERWYEESQVVVTVRVGGASVEENVRPLVDGGEFRDVFTDYRATVVEVLKNSDELGMSLVAGQSLTIRTLGGDVDRGAFVQRVRLVGSPSLRAGGKYLIALTWHRGYWWPQWGDQAVFDIERVTVTSQGRSAIDLARLAQPSASLLADVRRLAKR